MNRFIVWGCLIVSSISLGILGYMKFTSTNASVPMVVTDAYVELRSGTSKAHNTICIDIDKATPGINYRKSCFYETDLRTEPRYKVGDRFYWELAKYEYNEREFEYMGMVTLWIFAPIMVLITYVLIFLLFIGSPTGKRHDLS